MILKDRKFIFNFFVVCLFSFFLFWGLLGAPFFETRESLSFRIPNRAGIKEISAFLEEQKIIRSRLAFLVYVLVTGNAFKIQPGFYNITSTSFLSVPRLVSILVKGPPKIIVTIIPGMTIREIDRQLSSLGIIREGEILNFNWKTLNLDYPWLSDILEKDGGLTNLNNHSIIKDKTLEGFLFPDTYFFYQNSEARVVISKFLDNFEKKALPILLGKGDDIFRVLTLASILEKEIPDFFEQRLAAGILEKRYKIGMPLQVDATIIYSKCGGQFLECEGLKLSDYGIDSQYNTYLYKGFPPGPISNPSLQSIKAAVDPLYSEYLYYLSDVKTRKTIFSKTLDEHNWNKSKYLKK